MDTWKKLEISYNSLRPRMPFAPKTALVLGSNLGGMADLFEVEADIPYQEIEEFPVSTAPTHEGHLVFCRAGDVPIVLMKGRIHYYEGYSMQDVVLPVRLMKRIGAEILLLTNTAGGLSDVLAPGDIMLLKDQITTFIPSPLIGVNNNAYGPRFAGMGQVYSTRLQKLALEKAAKLGITIHPGTYLQLTGPQFETPAENRFYRSIGADAVGMSTACEAMAARHMGMEVGGLSFISNTWKGSKTYIESREEVRRITGETLPLFQKLTAELIRDAVITG